MHTATLKKIYNDNIINELLSELKLKNKFEAPVLEKICLNSSVSHKQWDAKNFEKIGYELTKIAGQKTRVVKAKMSVSSFNLREGVPIAHAVTLRNNNMYSFLEKLIYVALPRIRDFSFYKQSMFDKNFNFNFGISDASIFPEYVSENFEKTWGLDINFIIKAKKVEQSALLLKKFNFPLK